MSSPQRRAERTAQYEKAQQEHEAEYRRKEALTMWERIEEATASTDVKDILHRLAQHAGLEV